MNDAPGTRPRGTRKFRIGLGLTGLGVALSAYAALLLWPFISDLSSASTHPVPGEFQEELDEGSYVVAVQLVSADGGSVSFTQANAVEVLELTVTDPSGNDLAISPGIAQTINRNGQVFAGSGVFDAREPGLYTVQVTTTVETRAIVVHSLTSISIVGLLVGGIGGTALVVGLTLVVVGFFQRRSASTATEAPTGDPWPGPAMPPHPGALE